LPDARRIHPSLHNLVRLLALPVVLLLLLVPEDFKKLAPISRKGEKQKWFL
jgi:hypothetical protein